MEGMMRQMVMAGPRKSRIIEVPIPQYSDDEMLGGMRGDAEGSLV